MTFWKKGVQKQININTLTLDDGYSRHAGFAQMHSLMILNL